MKNLLMYSGDTLLQNKQLINIEITGLEFKTEVPAFLNNNNGTPIGYWENVRTIDGQLIGDLVLYNDIRLENKGVSIGIDIIDSELVDETLIITKAKLIEASISDFTLDTKTIINN